MTDSRTPQLLPDERIIWQGRPYLGLILRPVELFLIPFSLLWAGFTVFWNVNAWGTNADLAFKLFGLPFLVAGIYITFGRFIADAIIRRKKFYFITNKRVLIFDRGGETKTKSVDIRHLPALEFDEQSDGSGTIRFGSAVSWMTNHNFGIWQPTFDPTPQFIRIPNARSVYTLIQKQSDG